MPPTTASPRPWSPFGRASLLVLLALCLGVAPVFSQGLAFDFDLQPGDQGRREGLANPDGHAAVQICLSQAPPFSAWTAQILFDPLQARWVEGSGVAGGLLPGQELRIALVQEGVVEVGGVATDGRLGSGDGEVAQLEFAALAQGNGPVSLRVTSLHLHSPEAHAEVPVRGEGSFTLPDLTPGPVLLALEGAEARAHLLEQRACPGCDLGRQDLAQLDLNRVDLRQAQLQEATLLKADLQGADLRGAQLRSAVLLQADLREARFEGAKLKDVRLGGAKLQGADFRGAALDTLDLQGVNLSGAIWVDGRVCAPGSFGRCR